MSEGETELRATRILVAIELPPVENALLEAGAQLAAALRAELHGLFLPDIDLLRAAGLPFAREVSPVSGLPRRLDVDSVRRSLAISAQQVRRALASMAGRMQVAWSFTTHEGRSRPAVLSLVSESEILVVGRRDYRFDVGLVFRQISRPPEAAQRRAAAPVAAVYDGSPGSARALEVAANLAGRMQSGVEVLRVAEPAGGLKGTGGSERVQQRKDVEKVLHRLAACPFSWRTVARNMAAVTAACASARAGVLVLHRSSPVIEGIAVDEVLDRLHCPCVIV